MFVISANYRDRTSPYKWLVRRSDEPAEAARACKMVRAKKVEFTKSNAYEEGFGCSRVAQAEQVDVQEFETTFEPIRFSFNSFFTSSGKQIGGVEELILGADGSMQALLPKDTDSHATT